MRESRLKKRQRQRRKIRWGRLLFVLMLPLAASVLLGAWVYETYYQPPPKAPVVFTDKIKNVPAAKNQTNILLIAVSESVSNNGGGILKQAEAIVVAGINSDTNSCHLLAIPRDTLTTEKKDKISLAYTSGGVTALQSRTEEFLEIPVHHYLAMDKETFAQIIDLLGGVDLYVEKDLQYQDPYANLDIDLKHGYQRLTGQGAVGYVSYCTDELGEVGRIQRQRKFLEAFLLDKFSSLNIELENISELPQLKIILQTAVETDITPPVALKLANTLRNARQNSLKTEMLPGHIVVTDNTAYWESNKEEAKKLIAELFYEQ